MTAVPLDLELRLGPPRTLDDLAARSSDPGKAAENGETSVEQGPTPASDHAEAERPAPVVLQMFDEADREVPAYADPNESPGNKEADDKEAAVEPKCKRVKCEPPPSVADVPAPLPVPPNRVLPPPALSAPRRARKKGADRHPPAAHQGDAGATEPAWVRAELLPRHGLPGDLPLHFVEDKVLHHSDLNSNQNRLLIRSAGSKRLRALLSAGELRECGLNSAGRRRKRPPTQSNGGGKNRANPTKYPGVPVLVHGRAVEREALALRLNTFHSTVAMVINGSGYRELVTCRGFKKQDSIEVWAFRLSHDRQLCFVIAKRDDNRRPAINRQE